MQTRLVAIGRSTACSSRVLQAEDNLYYNALAGFTENFRQSETQRCVKDDVMGNPMQADSDNGLQRIFRSSTTERFQGKFCVDQNGTIPLRRVKTRILWPLQWVIQWKKAGRQGAVGGPMHESWVKRVIGVSCVEIWCSHLAIEDGAFAISNPIQDQFIRQPLTTLFCVGYRLNGNRVDTKKGSEMLTNKKACRACYWGKWIWYMRALLRWVIQCKKRRGC